MDQFSASGSEVRVGHTLNDTERQHVTKRREKVLQCLEEHGISCSKDEVPNIAVLGSGGGLRAMVGLLGSLSQLKKERLLDCITYLSGVSGSTWCMASLYKESDWSTNLETVKDNITRRLTDGNVSWGEMGQKLVKYSSEKKDNFTMTDIWAALIVSDMVKEIDEHKLSEQRSKYAKDPYPIYTVIDKLSKDESLNADLWFEMTPDEAGYTLSGAFVDSSCWGSRFENGKKTGPETDQPEIDILYLQGLCGSAIADMKENLKYIYNALRHLFNGKTESIARSQLPQTPDVQTGCEVISNLLELNLSVLNGEDPLVYCETLDELLKDKCDETGHLLCSAVNMMTKQTFSEDKLKEYNLSVCRSFFKWFGEKKNWDPLWIVILRSLWKVALWIWGTNYNYVYGMKDVKSRILNSETRDYEDAGLINNSPYFSVLRKERNIDLILSLDFSEGDPFETVVQTAKKCKELGISFPEVVVPAGGTLEPEDFYVFRGYTKAPTVIHIPLFNSINCKGEIKEWEKKYKTFHLSYSASMITDLLEKAGLNIRNNKEKLLKEIKYITEQKKTSKLG